MARALKIFMRGKRVTMLQELLGRMGYPMLDRPGQFGASTRDAVKQYQGSHKLKVTGIVDDALLQSMQQGQPVAPASTETTAADAAQSGANDGEQFEALRRLLIRKGLFTETEWQDELVHSQAKQLSGPPLV